ncbi:MAG: hypothetical protein PF448_08005 [Bacteroidales bacterium]|jgi:hypothetical protein|nr:hypothetical protein [Bacteroidales bacterium]
MKKLFITCMIAVTSITAFSQYVVVLHSADTTAAFTGSTSLLDAYNLANDGDTLYLSGGAFSITNIAKQLYVFGAGIHPDSSAATQTTRILTEVKFLPGADSSRFEGTVFEGNVEKHQSYVIDDLMFTRCKFSSNVDFGEGGTPSVNSKNYQLTESVFIGTLDVQGVVQSSISNCIFQNRIYNALMSDISNSVFLFQSNVFHVINNTSTTNFRNNVFHSTQPYIDLGSSNMYYNNLFVHATPDLGTGSTEIDNYKNVLLDDFYLSVPSTTFDFLDDYHPDPVAIPSFLGTDGEQIGVYGGLFPLKEGFIPQNPHVISKTIEYNTNESGGLPVEFDVSAQDE